MSISLGVDATVHSRYLHFSVWKASPLFTIIAIRLSALGYAHCENRSAGNKLPTSYVRLKWTVRIIILLARLLMMDT